MTRTVYHGSGEWDLEEGGLQGGMPGYEGSIGSGVYVAFDPQVARFYGQNVYAAELLIDEDDIFWLSPDTMDQVPGFETHSVLVGEQVPPFSFTIKGQRYTVGDEDMVEPIEKSLTADKLTPLVGWAAAESIAENTSALDEWVEENEDQAIEAAAQALGSSKADAAADLFDGDDVSADSRFLALITDAIEDIPERARSRFGLFIDLDDIGNEVGHAGYRAVGLEGARGRFPDEELLVFDSDDLKMIGPVDVDRIRPNPKIVGNVL